MQANEYLAMSSTWSHQLIIILALTIPYPSRRTHKFFLSDKGWKDRSVLRALAAFSEDLAYILNTHMLWLITAFNSSFLCSDVSFALFRGRHTHTHTKGFWLLMPPLRRQRQEISTFKASLVYMSEFQGIIPNINL